MTNEEFIESIRLENEEWKDIIGYEGLYAISSYGRVASYKHSRYTGYRIRKPYIQLNKNQRYAGITLSKGDAIEHFLIHRLVAIHFVDNPYNKEEVDHIDGNGLNNFATNLRWCNRSENNHNPITLKRQSDSHKCKKNPKKWKPIVRISKDGSIKHYQSLAEASAEGFHRSRIAMSCKSSNKLYKGYKFMYLSDYELLINKSKNPNGSERQLSLPF